jgi:hypothetical protein
MVRYPPGFEEREDLRSAFIREIILEQIDESTEALDGAVPGQTEIPRKLIRYWHDPLDLPEDVRACIESWDRLADEGFEIHMFNDTSAAAYIADTYGELERQAFARCNHPAMRCDYLRMCFVLAEGGVYVDADDVLLGDGWKHIIRDGTLKVQPMCYDINAGGMMPAAQIWQLDLPIDGHVYYVNNDPIAAPAHHPIIQSALIRATRKLLGEGHSLEIQSTTGPGNLTAALAAHARQLRVEGLPFDFELLRDWNSIAETRWGLSYRGDTRNWRNVYGS